MAINSNSNTKTIKLFIRNTGSTFADNLTVAQYDNGFLSDGTWDSGTYATIPSEDDYIDIGFVNDEREELSIGGLPFALPGTGADQTYNWAIMGKIMRVTISGTIPDGLYVPTSTAVSNSSSTTWASSNVYGSDITTYKSNSSVFKYKMSKLIAYQAVVFGLTESLLIHNVYYRRRYLIDQSSTSTNRPTNWVLSSYSAGFIEGTRVLKY